MRLDPRLAGPLPLGYYRTDFRLDSLAWGVGLAVLCEMERGRALIRRLGGAAPMLAALALLVVTFAVRGEGFRQTWRYSLQGLALTTLFCGLLFSGRWRLAQIALNLPAIVWVGRLSYSLYIWHEATPAIADHLLPGAPLPAQWAARLGLSFALAAASYYGLEKPFPAPAPPVRVRDRLRSRRGGPGRRRPARNPRERPPPTSPAAGRSPPPRGWPPAAARRTRPARRAPRRTRSSPPPPGPPDPPDPRRPPPAAVRPPGPLARLKDLAPFPHRHGGADRAPGRPGHRRPRGRPVSAR